MKQVLILAAVFFSYAAVAHADDFACEISVNGKSRTGYSDVYRGRMAIVAEQGYHCAGSMSNSWVKAYLYEPGETDDDDATKSDWSPIHTGATVERRDLGVTCHCGLY